MSNNFIFAFTSGDDNDNFVMYRLPDHINPQFDEVTIKTIIVSFGIYFQKGVTTIASFGIFFRKGVTPVTPQRIFF